MYKRQVLVQSAAIADHLGTADALLGRLEDHQHIELIFLVVFLQIIAQSQHHGHVGIVAAGVHAAVLAGKRKTGLLLDGQGVHIAPEGDGILCAIVKKGGVTSAADLLHLAVKLGQMSAYIFTGLKFLTGDFGNLMQIPAILNIVFHRYNLHCAVCAAIGEFLPR